MLRFRHEERTPLVVGWPALDREPTYISSSTGPLNLIVSISSNDCRRKSPRISLHRHIKVCIQVLHGAITFRFAYRRCIVLNEARPNCSTVMLQRYWLGDGCIERRSLFSLPYASSREILSADFCNQTTACPPVISLFSRRSVMRTREDSDNVRQKMQPRRCMYNIIQLITSVCYSAEAASAAT